MIDGNGSNSTMIEFDEKEIKRFEKDHPEAEPFFRISEHVNSDTSENNSESENSTK